MDKKDTSIAVHLSTAKRSYVRRRADRIGLSESEYIHQLLERDMKEQEEELKVLLELFPEYGSVRSQGTTK